MRSICPLLPLLPNPEGSLGFFSPVTVTLLLHQNRVSLSSAPEGCSSASPSGLSLCPESCPAPPCLQPGLGGGRVRAGLLQTQPPFCPQGELVTASKAIIEKEYQPHVIVSTTGPNPFNTLTDRELEEYRREVERKHRGPPGECSGEAPAPGQVLRGQARR